MTWLTTCLARCAVARSKCAVSLSERDREQAALLLRCAADLATQGETHAFTVALRSINVTSMARSAAYRFYNSVHWPALLLGVKPFDYHATLLEAAQLLCD